MAEYESVLAAIPVHQQRLELPIGEPIDFRNGEPGYLPQRIVELTPRVIALNYLIDKALKEKPSDIQKIEFRKQLFDLIIENAYGRVHPIPDSTGDVIGIPSVKESPGSQNLEHCIVLKKVSTPDGDKLAIAGAFVKVGEAVTQTIARTTALELGAKKTSYVAVFDEESKPNRDPRKVVVTTCATAEIDVNDLPEDTFIFPLYDPRTYRMISKYSEAGTYTDIRGKSVTHTGLLADHGVIISKLYQTWQQHSEVLKDEHPERLSLAKTMRKLSQMTPQEWCENYGEPVRSTGLISVGEITFALTPNIEFVLTHTKKIFSEYGFPDAQDRALLFVANCIRNNILPEYPQPSVTIDCVIGTHDKQGDKLLVQVKDDGSLALPGSFYSPEPDSVKQTGESIREIAQALVARKLGVDFRPAHYLGAVGGTVAMNEQADKRYPRISHVYIGTITGAYDTTREDFIEIPIWKNNEKGKLSDEILNGIDKKGWSYRHNIEILIPLLTRFLEVMDPERTLSITEILHPLTR